MYRRWPLAALAAALALLTAPAAFAAGHDPLAAAGWHGREIRDPLPADAGDAVARFPRGWSAGSVGRGTGYASANGSRRVREVQQRLVRRGYRPGPVDGRFGARTRAAVMWFQTKHGLARTGRVDARDVAILRQSTQAVRPPVTADAVPSSPPSAGTDAVVTPSAPLGRSDHTLLLALAVIMVLGLAVIVWWARAELRRRPARRAAVSGEDSRARLTAVPPPPPRAAVDVVGYVTLARGADRDRDLDAAARMVGSWCEDRGWQLTRLIHDVESAGGRIADRPGLAYALDQIAAGRAAGLVLARLGDLTRSVTELAQLLQWMHEAEAFVIALDYELDTSTTAGDLAAGALIEIGAWERDGIAGRTQPGLTAMRASGAATGHASVCDDPELSARISAMRARGMSLQAISDALNADGVPTLRGGTHWRPSSVQAATGYKRPPAGPGRLDLPRPKRAYGNRAPQRWDNDPS